MASKVFQELQQRSKPKHKEFAALYVPLFGTLSDDDITKIAEELQCGTEDVDGKLYEALRLFAVVNAVTKRKFLVIEGNERKVGSSDNSVSFIDVQETIKAPRSMPSKPSNNAVSISSDAGTFEFPYETSFLS